MLTGKRIPRVIEMNVEGHILITKQKIRYLEVQVDNCRRFGAHSEIVCGKADAIMGALRSLLPNVDGSTGSVRKLHYGTWESVMLYAAPVWAKTIKKKKNRNTLKRVQRSALMRSSAAYRTVFTGTLPIYYTIELRAEKYTLRYPFKRRSDLGLL